MMHKDPAVMGNPVVQQIINELNKSTDIDTAETLSKKLDPEILSNYIKVYFLVNPQHAPSHSSSFFSKSWNKVKEGYDYSVGKSNSKEIRNEMDRLKTLLSPNMLCGNAEKEHHGWGDWMIVIYNLGQMALRAQNEKSNVPILRDMNNHESWRCKIYHSIRGIIVDALRETNPELYAKTIENYETAYNSSVQTSAPGSYEGFDVTNITKLEDMLLLQLAYLEKDKYIQLVSKTKLLEGLVRVNDADDSVPKCLTVRYASKTYENEIRKRYTQADFSVFISKVMVLDETKATPQFVDPKLYRVRKKPSLDRLLKSKDSTSQLVDDSSAKEAASSSSPSPAPVEAEESTETLTLASQSVFNRDPSIGSSEEKSHSDNEPSPTPSLRTSGQYD